MEDLLNQIGSRILSRRKQLRMTQEELAEKAGITPQTVSSAELGKKALRPENIIRICSVLDSLVKQMPVTIPYCSPKFQTFLPYNTAIWRI